jgi:hypothetical protein
MIKTNSQLTAKIDFKYIKKIKTHEIKREFLEKYRAYHTLLIVN